MRSTHIKSFFSKAGAISLITLVGFLGTPAKVSASSQKFKVDADTIGFDMPAGWQSSKGLYGMPLVVYSAEQNGKRPAVITVTPTGQHNLPIDPKVLDKDQGGYKKWREAYLKQIGGKSVKYYPYQKEKWDQITDVHSIGYRFTLADATYDERSHFVVCKSQLFHVQSLVDTKYDAQINSVVSKTLRSFQCE